MTCIVIACASHSEAILDANLMHSPEVAAGKMPVQIKRGAASAAIAYNRALDATSAKVVTLPIMMSTCHPVGSRF
jgi:hypothetical protein